MSNLQEAIKQAKEDIAKIKEDAKKSIPNGSDFYAYAFGMLQARIEYHLIRIEKTK